MIRLLCVFLLQVVEQEGEGYKLRVELLIDDKKEGTNHFGIQGDLEKALIQQWIEGCLDHHVDLNPNQKSYANEALMQGLLSFLEGGAWVGASRFQQANVPLLVQVA